MARSGFCEGPSSGIDLEAGGKNKQKHRTAPASHNLYLNLLVKLYRFLARRTDSKFNKQVLKRLYQSNTARPPMSVRRLANMMQGREDKIAVLVGTVTDDIRTSEVPPLKVAALRFTRTARARIENAGGECLSIDQLALRSPTGKHTVLLRGPKKARESVRYFGAPGKPSNKTAPLKRNKSKNHENARGRRRSRHFKVA